MSELKTYKALHALSIDGNRFEIGQTLQLSADQAKAWGSDYVEEVSAEEKTMSEENVNQEQTPEQTPETTGSQQTGEQTPVEPTPSTEGQTESAPVTEGSETTPEQTPVA